MVTPEKNQRYAERNRELLRTKARERYHRYRAEVIEMLGGVCVKCGFSDERALEIDHVSPVRHRSGGKQWHQQIVHLRANPQEYQLLCANCHSIKSKGEY